ncbi:MAG TPA: FtsX-like permease family protein, partial [Chryseolinea sp.]|nr:FtsX-like permease family protein [Chryseolinea sp.]
FTRYENDKLKYTGNADHGFYADSAFLKIFSFPTLTGNENPLSEPKSVVLSRSFATKLFGNISHDKVIGSTIEIDAQGKKEHIVTAILEDVPANSHIQFDYLISYSTINSDRLEGNLGWSQFYTYILSNQQLTNDQLRPKLKLLLEKLYGKESKISIFFQPITDIYLTSDLREEVGPTGSARQLTFLSIIAYTILFMAWFNYINMSLARSMERINEIGIKKMLGSTRVHLVVQFFTESILINFISFSIAIIFLLLVQQPFESWIGKDISNIFFNKITIIWPAFIGIVVGTTLAGLYPAMVLSSYKPLQVVGRKFYSSKQGKSINNGLVYFQFIVSFTIVACTLIVGRQINHMKEANLGMNLSGCIAVRSPGGIDSTYQYGLRQYRERLTRHSFIKNVSVTSSIPGLPITTSGGVQRVIGPELEDNNVFFLRVDENFLNTYDIRLLAGRNFSDHSNGIPAIILNEAALQTLKFDTPHEALNHRIHWQGKEFEVIGVFANYNHLFLKESFEPIILSFHPSTQGFITLKIEDGHFEEAIALAKGEMRKLFPEAPFEYTFLESNYERQYRPIYQFEQLTKYFALLAIVIACTGLFALSYYSAQKRIKEVAIRKIFGANIYSVLLLLSRSYLKISLVSGILGSFLTFYLMNAWLQNFAFAIRMDVLDFLIPLASIACIAGLTVSYNCLKTSLVNPSQSLKHS